MKVKVTTEFRRKVEKQIRFIALDKPKASLNFKKLIFLEISKIPIMPFKNKKSKFFDNENIRELILKGYSIIYLIEVENNRIVVFGFHKWEDSLKL